MRRPRLREIEKRRPKCFDKWIHEVARRLLILQHDPIPLVFRVAGYNAILSAQGEEGAPEHVKRLDQSYVESEIAQVAVGQFRYNDVPSTRAQYERQTGNLDGPDGETR